MYIITAAGLFFIENKEARQVKTLWSFLKLKRFDLPGTPREGPCGPVSNWGMRNPFS